MLYSSKKSDSGCNDSEGRLIEVHCKCCFLAVMDVQQEGKEGTCEQDWERWRYSSVWDS